MNSPELITKIIESRVAQVCEEQTTWHVMHGILACCTWGIWLVVWAWSASRRRHNRKLAHRHAETIYRAMANGETSEVMRRSSATGPAMAYFWL